MATKKAAAPAKPAQAAALKKTVAKAAPAVKKCSTKKCAPKGAVKTAVKPAAKATAGVKGNKYSCKTCGLVVTVDKACGCVEMFEIVCCGAPMKASK
ncbi:MAG: hypothetical protein GX423_09695 [Nitrospiraceae bacterium]|nr:hypothetical protein [Nitrospiraceae bacterium]